ncbi:threonine ammonia-lyase IlvA [Marinilabiliaceae bacterium ANBcel2]|nr:threonine ammonia-lyase IlvA [Marinilabiliaceae bacterium ANBcel2]
MMNSFLIDLETIKAAYNTIRDVVNKTPLMYDAILSERYGAEVFLKREDLQIVRSYKIRGAYNKIALLNRDEKKQGVVCASAGNHAQGVAFACRSLNIKGKIFMPSTTPAQKIKQVRMFGREFIEIVITGDAYDDAYGAAMADCQRNNSVFIHPFDDIDVMAGQGTVGLEIKEQLMKPIDFMFVPVGGGGLIGGLGSYFRSVSASTKIIGVEPEGAPSMKNSLSLQQRVSLDSIEKFVDGAAVATVGKLTFEIASQVIDDMILVPEGKICTTILQLYNEAAIVAEPAGAMSISALDFYADKIKGKTVVCVLSGGNNDITRMEEIKERSLLYEGLKHYFIIRFPQRSGALKHFLNEVLGPDDDITYFEYTKKNYRENGPALVGIETKTPDAYNGIVERMKKNRVNFRSVNDSPDLFHFLI